MFLSLNHKDKTEQALGPQFYHLAVVSKHMGLLFCTYAFSTHLKGSCPETICMYSMSLYLKSPYIWHANVNANFM